MNNNYCVYIHTNKINNKRYIGLTCQKPENRWHNGKNYKHNKHFTKAIEKYGWDNFEHEIYSSNLSAEQASQLEIELINMYNTTDAKYGYNLDFGGSKTHHSQETKDKIKDAITGLKRSEDTKEKIRNAALKQKHKIGWKHTDESKRKNAEAHRNLTHVVSEETKNKIMISQRTRKEVLCVELNMSFSSIGSAAKYVNISQGSISSVLTGKSKTAAGYHWMYKQ